MDFQHRKYFLKGLAGLTGLSYEQLRNYADSNPILNVIDYPELINPNYEQLEKIVVIKKLIQSYNTLRTMENTRMVLDNVSAAGNYFMSLLEGKKDKEVFMVAFLDTRLKVIETIVVSEGNINSAPIYPREILKRALDNRCSSILLAHNHPSGDPTPSKEDIAVTQRLVNLFEPVEIQVNDHFIVGGMNYYSLRQNGISCFNCKDTANYEPFYYHNKSVIDEYGLEP